jgi:hypothetical protein
VHPVSGFEEKAMNCEDPEVPQFTKADIDHALSTLNGDGVVPLPSYYRPIVQADGDPGDEDGK